jgi:hypothetical protein
MAPAAEPRYMSECMLLRREFEGEGSAPAMNGATGRPRSRWVRSVADGEPWARAPYPAAFPPTTGLFGG